VKYILTDYMERSEMVKKLFGAILRKLKFVDRRLDTKLVEDHGGPSDEPQIKICRVGEEQYVQLTEPTILRKVKKCTK